MGQCGTKNYPVSQLLIGLWRKAESRSWHNFLGPDCLVTLIPKDHEGEGCGIISTRIISLILLNQWKVLFNLSNCLLLIGILTGITQERINEMRAAPEQVMICDIHDILATGQDLNRTDAQGATLVSETAAPSVLLSFSPQVMKPALEEELHKINRCKSLRGECPTHLLTCRELGLEDLPVTSCFSWADWTPVEGM